MKSLTEVRNQRRSSNTSPAFYEKSRTLKTMISFTETFTNIAKTF